ncbi:hypothetical protein Tco_1246689 [Tanacetum coccineum]
MEKILPSGVHTLELEDGTMLHMLTERRYPLSRELMIRMLDHGMEVKDESKIAISIEHSVYLYGQLKMVMILKQLGRDENKIIDHLKQDLKIIVLSDSSDDSRKMSNKGPLITRKLVEGPPIELLKWYGYDTDLYQRNGFPGTDNDTTDNASSDEDTIQESQSPNSEGRKIPESPWGSPIPIGDGDGDVNRFPYGDGDGDGDEAENSHMG